MQSVIGDIFMTAHRRPVTGPALKVVGLLLSADALFFFNHTTLHVAWGKGMER